MSQKQRNTFHAMRMATQTGFTLLEILVVIGLLTILALGMATMLEDDGDWRRDDVTEERWQRIRNSIIGEPNLTLNGSPQVAGYVADMGRLPFFLAELTAQDPIFDLDGIDQGSDNNFLDDACQFGANPVQQPDYAEIAISDYVPNVASGFVNTVSGGWRGPYLHTEGSRYFGDGWFGFRDGDAGFSPKDTQDCNFAWNVITTPATPATIDAVDALEVQSFGKDRVAGGTASGTDYPVDGLNMISNNEWTIGSAPITFNIQFNRAVIAGDIPEIASLPHQLQLVIYKYVDNGDNIADDDDLQVERADNTFTLSAGVTLAPAQTINLAGLPIGRYAAVIWCTNNNNLPLATANYTDDVVYDGTCKANNTLSINHSPVYFTITQSSAQVTIVWNLP